MDAGGFNLLHKDTARNKHEVLKDDEATTTAQHAIVPQAAVQPQRAADEAKLQVKTHQSVDAATGPRLLLQGKGSTGGEGLGDQQDGGGCRAGTLVVAAGDRSAGWALLPVAPTQSPGGVVSCAHAARSAPTAIAAKASTQEGLTATRTSTPPTVAVTQHASAVAAQPEGQGRASAQPSSTGGQPTQQVFEVPACLQQQPSQRHRLARASGPEEHQQATLPARVGQPQPVVVTGRLGRGKAAAALVLGTKRTLAMATRAESKHASPGLSKGKGHSPRAQMKRTAQKAVSAKRATHGSSVPQYTGVYPERDGRWSAKYSHGGLLWTIGTYDRDFVAARAWDRLAWVVSEGQADINFRDFIHFYEEEESKAEARVFLDEIMGVVRMMTGVEHTTTQAPGEQAVQTGAQAAQVTPAAVAAGAQAATQATEAGQAMSDGAARLGAPLAVAIPSSDQAEVEDGGPSTKRILSPATIITVEAERVSKEPRAVDDTSG